MSLPKLPDAYASAYALRKAILANQRPCAALDIWLKSGRPDANFVANQLNYYKEMLKVLTSKDGRAYMHRWLDDTLNYLALWANIP